MWPKLHYMYLTLIASLIYMYNQSNFTHEQTWLPYEVWLIHTRYIGTKSYTISSSDLSKRT